MRTDREQTPRHSKEALNDAAMAAQRGGPAEAEALRAMMRPYVISMARRLDALGGDGYSREMSDELKQSLWAGVWVALGKFDLSKGTKFSSYAYFWMRHEAQEWMAKNSRALPISRVAWAQSLELEREFQDAHGVHALIETASDATLSSLVIYDPKNGRARTVPHAGEIIRAKANAYAFDDSYDGQGNTDAAEDEFFEEAHDMDTDALETVSAMAELLAEGGPTADDDSFEMAAAFVDRHDLPAEVAERMLEQAELGG